MADVRSMLRAERANRRITHPHASYTGDGKLLCNLCETLVKSEAQWQSHLHSTKHNLRSQREREAASIRNAASQKKRKADDLDSPPPPDERKKVKAAETAVDGNADGAEEPAEDGVVSSTQTPSVVTAPSILDAAPTNGAPISAQTTLPDDVDDAEFAAFEREIAALDEGDPTGATNAPGALSALDSKATISAAPMSAEDLAAQARDEHGARRGKQDAEIEAERDDAARVLEDEFEEMEGLEGRLRKLKQRRDALKQASPEDAAHQVAIPTTTDEAHEQTLDDDSDFDDDDWNFGGA